MAWHVSDDVGMCSGAFLQSWNAMRMVSLMNDVCAAGGGLRGTLGGSGLAHCIGESGPLLAHGISESLKEIHTNEGSR